MHAAETKEGAISMNWPSWLGDLPTWVTAAAVVFAAGSYNLDRARQRADAERDAREQASRLSAWVVTDPDERKRTYGVILDNCSGSAFRDVSVVVRMFDAVIDRPIRLVMLPPGRYFVELSKDSKTYTWKFAAEVPSHTGDRLRPIMQSAKYQVHALEFTDTREQRWRRDESFVLSRARES